MKSHEMTSNQANIRRRKERYLWPTPHPSGWILNRYASRILLLSDHAPTIDLVCAELSKNSELGVYALCCGGFSIRDAAALGNFSRQEVDNRLTSSTENKQAEKRTIYIPASLACSMNLQVGDMLGDYQVCLCSDHPMQAIQQARAGIGGTVCPSSALKTLAFRLSLGFRLGLGQILLFFIPLCLFGWKAAWMGTSMLLSAMIFLALIWKIIPTHAPLKGIIWGGLLAGGWVGISVLTQPTAWIHCVWMAGALWLITFWCSIVLNGLRAE